jgi:hypothetical protein
MPTVSTSDKSAPCSSTGASARCAWWRFAGGFLEIGDRHVLLPVDAITRVGKRDVLVNQTRERITGSPAYDPKLSEKAT